MKFRKSKLKTGTIYLEISQIYVLYIYIYIYKNDKVFGKNINVRHCYENEYASC
jgi:hypothetical protein